jgi:hypothetical protein
VTTKRFTVRPFSAAVDFAGSGAGLSAATLPSKASGFSSVTGFAAAAAGVAGAGAAAGGGVIEVLAATGSASARQARLTTETPRDKTATLIAPNAKPRDWFHSLI